MEINKRSVSTLGKTIKLYRYNRDNAMSLLSLCFNNNNKYCQEKLNAIVYLIRSENICVIYISNVTLDWYNYLYDKLGNLYDNVQVFKTEDIRYTSSVFFLLKSRAKFIKSADNPYYFDLENSSMERKIIGCEIILEDIKINLLGIHLESGIDCDTCRIEQVDILTGIIKELRIDNYIILGNFEKCDSIDTTYIITKKINDGIGTNVWNELGCSMLTRGDNTEKIIYNSTRLFPEGYMILDKIKGIPENYGVYTGILCSFGIK